MQNNTKTTIIISLFVFSFLTSILACGGGSSGEPPKEPEPQLLDPWIKISTDNKVIVDIETELDASASESRNNQALRFKWLLISKPSDSQITFEFSNESKFSIVFDEIGEYIFSIEVSESVAVSSSKTITVNVTNTAPSLSISKSFERVTPEDTVILDATNSFDPDGHEVKFSWKLNKKPSESQVDISTQQELRSISVSPDVVGIFEFSLTLTDGHEITEDIISLDVANDTSEYSIYSLDFVPVNPRYNSELETLYFLDKEQPYLYGFEVKKRELVKITLPNIGTNFSFSQDNSKAVVSIDSKVVFVDLVGKSTINQFAIEAPAGDLVYLDDGVAIFPGSSNFNARHTQIRFGTETALRPKVLQANGLPTAPDYVREGALAHYNKVNGEIYIKENSVGHIARLTPGDGVMTENIRSPVTAGIEEVGSGWIDPIGFDFWFAHDGNILTSMGNLLKYDFSGRERTQDEILIRRLSLGEGYGSAFIWSADHNINTNKILIAINPYGSDIDDSKIYEFNYETFELEKEYQLPSLYGEDGTEWPIYGYRVFTGSDSTPHIALGYVDTRSELHNPFIIAVHENGELVRNKRPILDTKQSLFSKVGEDYTLKANPTPFDYRERILSTSVTTPENSNSDLIENDLQEFNITPDLEGVYEFTTKSTNKFGESLNSFLRLNTFVPYELEAIKLGSQPIDSIYDPISNYVYTITTSNKLIKVNGDSLETQEIEFVDEELFRVRVSPDGKTLALSTIKNIKVLDANSLEVLRTYKDGFVAADIMFIDDRKFVVSPRRFGSFEFDYTSFLIDAFDGLVYTKGLMSDMHCKFRSRNQRMICTRPLGFSDESLHSYQVSDTDIVEERKYDQTSLRDSWKYPNRGNLEISPDGNYVLTKGGFIYDLTNSFDDPKDLSYFERFDPAFRNLNSQNVQWSRSGKFIYRINATPTPFAFLHADYIERYEFKSMNLKEQIRIPNSIENEKMYARKILAGPSDNDFFIFTCDDDTTGSYSTENCELVKYFR
jgi:K319L-like, PKD domain